jgi:nicotinamide-nucleotide amidase
VGTELLLGQIANTNAQRISAALATIGVDVYFHTAVGDNLERIAATVTQAVERSDAVIVTGGLGPTPDDLTREAVATALDRRLIRDEGLVEEIRAVFGRLGRHMPEENLKQADLPEGAVAIDPEGTAPGFYAEDNGALVIALPGVPWEMEAMLTKTVIPLLRARAGAAAIVSREVIVVGLGESATQELISDIVASQSNPTIAYLAGRGQVRVRLTAKAPTESEALALVEPIEEEIRARLGPAAVPGHHVSLAAALAAMLRERGATVATAESLTGGLIGAELTAIPGASTFFAGALVVYTTDAKVNVAGLDAALLDGPGPVSEEAAAALAHAAADRFGAELGLSATGVAGPDQQQGLPVGMIFVAAHFGGRTEVRRVRGYGDRDHIRAIAVTSALDLGRRLLEGTP